MEKISWITEKRNLSELVPAPYNPRKWDEESTSCLTDSIDKFDLADPIIINRNNTIIGGHFRFKILKEKGVESVDVRIPSRELNIEEERELNLRLNKNTGEWDHDLLSEFDEDVLSIVGFDSKELDRIFQIGGKPEDDEVPEEKKETNIARGDTFKLGRHRLMCGDATSGGDVAILMDGKKASITFTSPPYNLGKSIKLSGNLSRKNIGNVYLEFQDDDDENWLRLMNSFSLIALENSDYVFTNIQPLAGNRINLWRWADRFSSNFCDLVVWDKGQGAPAIAKNVMNSVFELIFIHELKNPSRAINSGNEFRGTLENMLRIPKQSNNEFSSIHGATFPLSLPQHIILNFTKRDNIVLDQFCGTGTTLIACEKNSRICYGMEIDPQYCQVIIDRWEKFSGEKAVCINSEAKS